MTSHGYFTGFALTLSKLMMVMGDCKNSFQICLILKFSFSMVISFSGPKSQLPNIYRIAIYEQVNLLLNKKNWYNILTIDILLIFKFSYCSVIISILNVIVNVWYKWRFKLHTKELIFTNCLLNTGHRILLLNSCFKFTNNNI